MKKEPYSGYTECCARWAKVRAGLPKFDAEKYLAEKQADDERHEREQLARLKAKYPDVLRQTRRAGGTCSYLCGKPAAVFINGVPICEEHSAGVGHGG